MINKYALLSLLSWTLLFQPGTAKAWFFIIPIPNLSKPATLNSLIDALERSEETKALAYVSEDKTFGSKRFAWGHFAGHTTQAEADRKAMSACESNLQRAKAEKAGGKELYDFGEKKCELYSFANKSVSPRALEAPASTAIQTPPTTPPPQAPAQPTASSSSESASTGTPTSPLPPTVQTAPEVQGNRARTELAPNAPKEVVPPGAIASPPTAQPPSGGESAAARKLRELNELRKEGLITQKDYDEKKKKILESM